MTVLSIRNASLCLKCGSNDIIEYVKEPVMFLCRSCGHHWFKEGSEKSSEKSSEKKQPAKKGCFYRWIHFFPDGSC